MSRVRRFVLCGALLISASGVHAQQFRAVPIRDYDIPLQLSGALVKPPPGKNWHFLIRTESDVMLGKPPDPATHTIYATARVSRLAAPAVDVAGTIAELQRLAKQEYESPRFEQVSIEVAGDAGFPSQCFQMTLRAIDKGSAQAPGTPLRMLGRFRGCVHPRYPQYAVELMYSERGGGLSWTPGLEQEGEAFFASLRFIDLTPDEASRLTGAQKTP